MAYLEFLKGGLATDTGTNLAGILGDAGADPEGLVWGEGGMWGGEITLPPGEVSGPEKWIFSL